MTVITTLYEGSNLDFSYAFRSRTKQQGDDSGRLMRPYVSASGNESLIFNPRASLRIRSRNPAIRVSTTIPIEMANRFMGVLTSMMPAIADKELFREDGEELFVATSRSVQYAKKMTVHRDTIVLMPAVAICYGSKERGVSLAVNGDTVGTLSYSEIITLAELTKNFDPKIYELVAGLSDEINRLDGKIDNVCDTVMRVECMIAELLGKRKGTMTDGFDWTSVGMNNF